VTWQEINNKRLPFIRMGERLFKGMYAEIRKGLISSLTDLTQPEEIIEVAKNYIIPDELIRSVYERFYIRTGVAFAKSIVKSHRRDIETKQEDDWVKEIVELIRTTLGLRISKVTKTHYKDIELITRRAVEEGIKEGWGMDKIARSIQKTQVKMDYWKSLQLARTETNTASNIGVDIGAKELPGNKEKVWISTFKQTSRPDHMAMDGVRVAYNDNFTLPSGAVMRYPLDPECIDHPEEIVNCGCGYEIIVSSEYF